MADTCNFVGALTIGTSTVKKVNLAIDVTTESVTFNKKGTRTIADVGAELTLNLGGITNPTLIWLKVTRDSDESLYPLRLEVDNGSANQLVGFTSVLMFMCVPKNLADITVIKITPDAAVACTLEYVVAGD